MSRSDNQNWFVTIATILVLVLVNFLAGCGPSSIAKALNKATATPKPTIQLQSCQLEDISAQCGTLTVYENRGTNTGRTIDIHMAVVKASGPNPEPDPIFFFAGGPGGSGLDEAAYVLQVLKTANLDRDIVLFDQRGTGASHRLACPRRIDEAVGLVPIDDKMLQELKNCLADLDADPGAYTTAWSMDDLDDLRAALGYDQINLYGESYGPTAEQVYLQRHSNHVRTMALEGVSLLNVPMFEWMPHSSQERWIFCLPAARPTRLAMRLIPT